MMEKVYLTMHSENHWKVINSLWAAIRLKNFLPDRVYILTDREDMRLQEELRTVVVEHGGKGEIKEITVNLEDFVQVTNTMMEIMKEEGRYKNRIAVDITGGRRTAVAGALLSAWNEEIHHAFYLYVDGEEKRERELSTRGPYMMIPISHQRIHDIIEEGENAW